MGAVHIYKSKYIKSWLSTRKCSFFPLIRWENSRERFYLSINMIMNKNITTLCICILLYLFIKHSVPYGNYIVYPITLLVTFLHEFWHAFFAIITWGGVASLQINTDGSWVTETEWWVKSLILIWGYIWSALFWNILLYISIKKQEYSRNILYILWWLMIWVWIFWFSWLISSILLFLFWGILILIARQDRFQSTVLQFLWLSSLLYIIEDFNVWPRSDISKFADIFIVIPEFIWMGVWLLIVLMMVWYNIKIIMKK